MSCSVGLVVRIDKSHRSRSRGMKPTNSSVYRHAMPSYPVQQAPESVKKQRSSRSSTDESKNRSLGGRRGAGALDGHEGANLWALSVWETVP